MNLAKVALYLEYIAFRLRREETTPMKKTESEEPKAKKSPRKLSDVHRALARIEALLEPLSHADRGRILEWLRKDWLDACTRPQTLCGPVIHPEMGSGL